MGVQLTYMLTQHQKTVKKNTRVVTSYGIQAILFLCYLFYRGVYALQLLYTASLVGRDW